MTDPLTPREVELVDSALLKLDVDELNALVKVTLITFVQSKGGNKIIRSIVHQWEKRPRGMLTGKKY